MDTFTKTLLAVLCCLALALWYSREQVSTLRGQAAICTAAVKIEEGKVKVLAIENEAARKAATTKANGHKATAAQMLATPASNSDSCMAAQERLDKWLDGR